jgi:hypothetical protein
MVKDVRNGDTEQGLEKQAAARETGPGDVGRRAMQGDAGVAGDGQVEARWVDRGIRDVPVSALPDPDWVQSEADFQKVSALEMKEGMQRLQTIQQMEARGLPSNSESWRAVDQKLGQDYRHGYQGVYEAFYGDTAIRLEKDGDRYNIINGGHRIWLAKQEGISSLPARVIERVPPSAE